MNHDFNSKYFSPVYIPGQLDVTDQFVPGWVVLIIVIILIIVLLISEYKAHDCIPGKTCTHSVPKPTVNDNNFDYIDKLTKMVQNNYDYISWRQALIVALIVPLPVIYYLKGRIPTLMEWLIIGILVFLIVYLASSWIWSHFFFPNGQAIERNLQDLKKRFDNNQSKTKNSNRSKQSGPKIKPEWQIDQTQHPL